MGTPPVGNSVALFPDDDNEGEAAYRSEGEEAVVLVQNEPSRPRKISQKKAVEQASFGRWLSKNRPNLSEKTPRPSSVQQESLQYMIKSCEGGEKIIHSPRDYQLELFERAKHENTIAVLDTGKPITIISAYDKNMLTPLRKAPAKRLLQSFSSSTPSTRSWKTGRKVSLDACPSFLSKKLR